MLTFGTLRDTRARLNPVRNLFVLCSTQGNPLSIIRVIVGLGYVSDVVIILSYSLSLFHT